MNTNRHENVEKETHQRAGQKFRDAGSEDAPEIVEEQKQQGGLQEEVRDAEAPQAQKPTSQLSGMRFQFQVQ